MFCCLSCVEWFFSQSNTKENFTDWDEKLELIAVDHSERRKKEWLPSMMLIIKRNLPREAAEWRDKEVLDAVSKISHLQLDGESIELIDFIHFIDQAVLTNIYLQNNKIQHIRSLEGLNNLQLLDLSNNDIEVIENLSTLSQLAFLDLSHNYIGNVDIDELPQSLMILHLKGNPCYNQPDYRGRIIQDLPNLTELDGVQVGKGELQECGYVLTHSDDDDDEEEEEGKEKEAVRAEDGG
ncbi:leucine-rich repeat-containing protein 46-like, partial [Argonauta hians]